MDILSKKITSYFQPIIAVDTNEIYSFEVLGRHIDGNGTVKSLGAFFSDKTASSADALEIDRIVRKHALKQYAKEGKGQYLFINLRLEWIANYAGGFEEMPTRSDRVNARREFWDLRVGQFFSQKKLNFHNNINDYFSGLCLELLGLRKGIYLCDRRGKQLSYNI